MSRTDDARVNDWQYDECMRLELIGRGMTKECLTAQRMASIFNKNLITIKYNQVRYSTRYSVGRFSG